MSADTIPSPQTNRLWRTRESRAVHDSAQSALQGNLHMARQARASRKSAVKAAGASLTVSKGCDALFRPEGIHARPEKSLLDQAL